MPHIDPNAEGFSRWLQEGESFAIFDLLEIPNRIREGRLQWQVVTAEQAHLTMQVEKEGRDHDREKWVEQMVSRGLMLMARATSGFPISKIFTWNLPGVSIPEVPKMFVDVGSAFQTNFFQNHYLRSAAKFYEPQTKFADA